MNKETDRAEDAARPPAALSLAIDKAINTSYHAGVAWLIVKGSNVTSGSTMAGYPSNTLFESISRARGAEAVYLSSPPYELFVDEKELLEALEKANIWELHIPKIAEQWWKKINDKRFANATSVKIVEHPVDQIGNQIYHGPYTLLTKNRPWVTGITMSHLNGSSLSINGFEEDVGVNLNIRDTVSRTHAIAVEGGEKDAPFVPEKNIANGEPPVYRINSIEDFIQVLRYQNLLQLPTLSLVGSAEMIKDLMNLDLIDEVVHYCMVLSGESDGVEDDAISRGNFPGLEGWQMTGSSVLKRGVRIKFSRVLF
ncbi:hypothetical protein [Marinimicrobium locisalis]|uniref:hypothetical protein n=1 Tax=Marinimicrobium locisalis TaxID=546022 RepID=UPI003221718D